MNEYVVQSTFCQQLKATLVRNLRLKWRDSRKTTAEVFLPLYTLGTLIVLKVFMPNPNFPALVQPRGDARLFEHFNQLKNQTIAVVPHRNTTVSHTMVFLEYVNELWLQIRQSPSTNPIRWILYDTPEEMLSAYWRDPFAMPLALVFHSDDLLNDPLKYEIRTNPSYYVTPTTTELYSSPINCRQSDSFWSSMVPIETGDTCPVNQYYYSGFVALQFLLDHARLSISSPNSNFKLNVTLEMFPKEAYTANWIVAFRLVIPIYMVMALSQFITYLLILIVGEKENHIKEGLKIMGLRDSVYWLSWFIIYAVFVTFLTLISVILLFSLGVFQHANYLAVFVLVLLYSFSVILIGFMITPFFDNSRTAGILGNFAVNIMSLLYFIQVFVDNTDTSITLWIVSLISPTGFALAMDKILLLDISGQRVSLDNLWMGPGIPLGGSMLMIFVDIVLYAALAFYLDCVVPGDHGTKHKPWFCFSKKYWFEKQPPKLPLLNGESVNSLNNLDAQQQDVEPVSREMRGKEAIKIVDLYKSFHSCRKPEVKAVNGINLTIYEGQITAILGHNGAGKSTLFNILTGMCQPSSGTVYIFGYDVRNSHDMTQIRRMTGVCPQHDILFDQLTPKEHFYFFSAVRGIPRQHIDSEVKKTLKDCDLFETAADTRAKNLSGGQKRKLSVGIAIIGDPKIIILDEPTAGVDPYSRRHMWSLLQNRKHGKVILLTTHFMDEADILADRKAVIFKGRLRCCGSSLFLKNKFGVGYHLTLVLEPNARESAITKLVNLHVAKAEKARHHGRELSYILTHDAVDNFAALFFDIEQEILTKKQRLGILSYGVSMTTLEEVFLQLETERGDQEEDTDVDQEPPDTIVNIGKKIVQNRALSRSLSLQGRSNSYNSLRNCNMAVANSPSDAEQLGKGTIRSLPENCSINSLRYSASNRVSLFEIESSEPSAAESKGKTSLLQSNGKQSDADTTKSRWFELDNMVLCVSRWNTLWALLKIRVTILLRDLQRLYLMIILPLGFTAIGLYLNSIQVIMPSFNEIVLDNGTYGHETKIAVYDATMDGSSDDDEDESLGYYRFVNELRKFADIDETFDGNFSSLLDIGPHMGALHVKSMSEASVQLAIYYNDTAQHSLPVLLNILSNTLYQLFSSSQELLPSNNIEIRSHPFQQTFQPQGFNIGTLSSALFIGMIFILIPVTLSVDMVYDREMKAKNQLRVNGLSTAMYFVAYCIVLCTLQFIICAALLGLIFLFDVPSLKTFAALATLGVLIVLYSPVAILCSTCFSYFFDRTESAQSFLPNILTFVGLIPFLLVAVLDMLEIEVRAAIALHYVFTLINPMYIPYAAVYFVDRVYVACTLNNACDELTLANYMTQEVIVMAFSVLLHIPIWSVCLRLAEIKKSGGRTSELFGRSLKVETHPSSEECYGEFEDDDVRNERNKVNRICGGQQNCAAPVVLVKNLRKEFSQENNLCCGSCCGQEPATNALRVAVGCLSLSVDAGEVLGLLGHNGAGKTTTMKIMTGETYPTTGQVQIGGHDVIVNKADAFKTLGYCPQHDALWKTLTVKEHLEVYAAIRGVQPKDIPRLISTYMHALHISEHANKQTQHCSGGTRRKLSYAISMVGAPKVVLLDEPSTGMDPKSKRFLWDTILSSFQNTRGAILTTHSMEEADALCSRVGIMVKGELRCLGSTQHLKNLYGAGYTLEIKLKHYEESYNNISTVENGDGLSAPLPTVAIQMSSSVETAARESQLFHATQDDRVQALKNFVNDLFPDACLEESFADRLVYSVPQHAVSSLAQCFHNLEKAKTELDVEEYSFSQTTLEQVFLKFAHYNEDISNANMV